MSFDNVLEQIGGHGRYQITVLLVLGFCKMFPGASTLLPVFMADRQQYTCAPPSSLKNQKNLLIGHCSFSYEDDLGKHHTVKCRHWTFNTSQYRSTISSKYGLICEYSYLNQLSTTTFFLGFMIGCTAYGVLSDQYGRLTSLYISGAHLFLSGIGAAFATSYRLFCLCRCLNGVAVGGFVTILFTMTSEVVDKKHRVIWCFTVSQGWSLGILYTTLIAYYVRDVRLLQVYNLLPLLSIFIILPLFIYESPRWLYTTGKLIRAKKTAQKIAKINNRVTDIDLTTLFKEERTNQSVESGQLGDLLRHQGIRRVTLALWFSWCVGSLGYYGLSLGVAQLGGSVYFNQVLSAFVEIPSRILGIFAGARFGRRPSMMVGFGVAAFCLASTAFCLENESLKSFVITAAMMGKFWITFSLDTMWLYTSEAYPTTLRNIGIGSCSTSARIGGMLAPQVALLGTVFPTLSYFVMSAFMVLPAIMTKFLPETRDHKLPETIEECERFIITPRNK